MPKTQSRVFFSLDLLRAAGLAGVRYASQLGSRHGGMSNVERAGGNAVQDVHGAGKPTGWTAYAVSDASSYGVGWYFS
jgi:hypothetical protein